MERRLFGRSTRFVQNLVLAHVRKLTSTEVATALRPFYFSVHPDLFGKFPTERATNENSLQALSSYIETFQRNKKPPAGPHTLPFYIRPQGVASTNGNLKAVNIKLGQSDLRHTVASILSTCDLPTTYVDQIQSTHVKPKPPPRPFWSQPQSHRFTDDTVRNERVVRERVSKAKESTALLKWLKENSGSAKEKLKSGIAVREEVVRLQKEIKENLGLEEIVWDCGWDIAHFRGSLQAFQNLMEHHAEHMGVLRGRKLVFGTHTGVSFDGCVLLNSAEVRHNWLDFIKNVNKEEVALKTLPHFEKALSIVLRDIQIVRRKFQPKTMASQYEGNLKRLTTSLSDLQGSSGYPKSWPQSLSIFELVVETEAGPLMVSPTGQFIVPCSCPSFLIVSFITDNMEKAQRLLEQYKTEKHLEKDLHKKCLDELKLVSLDKDDSVTPQPMIACCQNLLEHKNNLEILLEGTRLMVTNYYSVMSDGQMCIPWNWKL